MLLLNKKKRRVSVATTFQKTLKRELICSETAAKRMSLSTFIDGSDTHLFVSFDEKNMIPN